jgi:MFS family permease
MEVPETAVAFVQMVGVILVGIGAGTSSVLVQAIVRALIPYLGEVEAGKFGAGLNSLFALLIPAVIGYLLVLLMSKTGMATVDTWAFIVLLMTSVAAGQGLYEVKARRK